VATSEAEMESNAIGFGIDGSTRRAESGLYFLA
jgi:hypothetical protein